MLFFITSLRFLNEQHVLDKINSEKERKKKITGIKIKKLF